MKYLCLICAETVMEQMTEAAAEKHFEEYSEFTQAIRDSGHYLGCNRLLPPNAAIALRVRNGKVTTTNGPFAETKEQFGGYYLIEARDLNEAIQVDSRIPERRSAASKCGRLRRTNKRCGRSGLSNRRSRVSRQYRL